MLRLVHLPHLIGSYVLALDREYVQLTKLLPPAARTYNFDLEQQLKEEIVPCKSAIASEQGKYKFTQITVHHWLPLSDPK